MRLDKEVCFLIPTLNEKNNILKTIDRINEIIKELKIEYEIIIIDDNSEDGTLEILKDLDEKNIIKLVIPAVRSGLGNALLLGLKESKSNYNLFLDCDFSVKKDDIMNLIKKRKNNLIIIGSRYNQKSNTDDISKIHYILSFFLNFILRKILFLKVTDLTHSFRIFPSEFTLDTNLTTHPGFFIKFALSAKKNKFQITEIPITNFTRKHGYPKNKLFKMIISVLGVFIIK